MTTIAKAAIRVATPSDLRPTTEIMATGFHPADLGPWLIPSPAVRAQAYPRYFGIFAEHALVHGHVDLLGDVAVAVWYVLDGVRQIVDIPYYDRRLAKAVGPRYLPRFVALDKAMHTHHPIGAHHYLAFLAVRPDHQGRGYGSLLLRHHLQSLDPAGMPSYLEATGPRNAALYRRHGYTNQPAYAIDGDSSPLLYPMWRDPQPPPRRSAIDPRSKVP